mmetsp:Transcript_1179/g.4478  ORF Transcript_1179/g.4478 Transcript_1179/m.4478 type:complete len:229 (-) Transcript_1179:2401-3087(-)
MGTRLAPPKGSPLKIIYLSNPIFFLVVVMSQVHEPPAEVLGDHRETIARVLELCEELVWLSDACALAPPHVQDGVVLRRADGTLPLVLPQAPRVERVHAQEVNGGQLQRGAAGRALAVLEHPGLGLKFLELLLHAGGLPPVLLDGPPVLVNNRALVLQDPGHVVLDDREGEVGILRKDLQDHNCGKQAPPLHVGQNLFDLLCAIAIVPPKVLQDIDPEARVAAIALVP